MSEFFIQDRQLSSITRTIVKDEKGKSLFLMVGRWGTKGDALSSIVWTAHWSPVLSKSVLPLAHDLRSTRTLKK